MSKILRTKGPSVLVARFDTARTSGLRQEEVQHLAYHVARLITGHGSAESEWRHFGIEVEVESDMDQGDD